MQRIDGRLVLSPTDLTKHLACPHVTTLDLQALDGPAVATETDDALDLVFAKGRSHEESYLASLVRDGRSVVEIPTRFDAAGRRAAEQLTVEAMQRGVEVIYQATFFDSEWGGQADFLLRTDRPSGLGPWSYDIADTKLARHLKVPALLQMASYAERLTVLQGAPVYQLWVVTGDGVQRPWLLVDVASYARRARSRLRTAVELRPVTEAVPVQHCAQCRWSPGCTAEWVKADDLSLVAFMRADHRLSLRQNGIATVNDLAAADPAALPLSIGRGSRDRLLSQARLQVAERSSGTPTYELLEPKDLLGLSRLPTPDAGDVYLDFEGDPYAEEGAGREYLAGIGDSTGGFQTLWAHSGDEERDLTVALVDHLLARWRQYPSMHVYHYAPYETAALKRLTGRYGVREAELDQLLRGKRFVDLYAVVRQGLRISKPSYSIKSMEAFYWGAVRSSGDVPDAMASVVAYEKWLADRDADTRTLPQIEAYNREDVRSTAALHRWLEDRRVEAAEIHGALPRPGEIHYEPTPLSPEEVAENALAERLRMAGQPLLAALVQWHRREMRPAWWEIFRLKDLTHDGLVEDGTALGGLSAPEWAGTDKRSTLWRYTFPPQDTKVSGDALDVDTAETLGSVFEIDAAGGWLVLKVGPGRPAPRPRGFAPNGPPGDKVMRESIAGVAEEALAWRTSAGLGLLHRRVPTGLAVRPTESAREAVVRVGRTLSGEVLAVQGPPGSGKTTVAAELIQALLDDGKRVGVTATSHAVIGNLLKRVERPALQRCGTADFCGAAGVAIAKDNAVVEAALRSGTANLVGGTAWLWSRGEMNSLVDVLVVDEAGQFSLANAVAVAQAASSLVLLGDPQQLTQPTQAQHPDGADASALGHLLEGRDTVWAERGIFLDTSWRMHQAITDFVSVLSYEGRLTAGPGLERQQISAPGLLAGSGLRFVPVEHAGNSAGSAEEVEVVGRLVFDLLAGRFVDRDGRESDLSLDKIMVVAPYNNQVGRLRAALPPGARVGTVDKFQGQEAPVVLYSMASSSAEDAPRGVGFLYDLHRLNVAISRAQALAVVVASPRLLDAAVHSPEQLRKVNALCRYAEVARNVSAVGSARQ